MSIFPELSEVGENCPAIIKCIHEKPVTWIFPNEKLDSNILLERNSLVHIKSFQRINSGLYICHEAMIPNKTIGKGWIMIVGKN